MQRGAALCSRVPAELGQEITQACVRDLIFLSREGRDLGVAFQAPPGSQASSRGEANAGEKMKSEVGRCFCFVPENLS